MPFLGVGSGTVLQQGTASSRPAASTALQGVYYFCLDTNGGTLYQCTGAAWVQLAPGVVSGMVQLAQTILGSSAASITLSGIAGTYTHLMVVLSNERDDTGSLANELYVQVNADTGSNYANSIGGSTTVMRLGTSCGGATTANFSNAMQLWLLSYAGTTIFKLVTSVETRADGSSAGPALKSSVWKSVAAITSIKAFPSSGNFAAGTTATLYGVA